MKREKIIPAEKRQFVRQMADLLKGAWVVVPALLIPEAIEEDLLQKSK